MLAGRLRSPHAGPRRPDEVAAPAAPPTLVRLGATLLWDNLAALVVLNLVGSLAAAPLVALGLLLGFVPFVVLSAVAFHLVLGGLIGAAAGELRGAPGGWRRRFVATIRTRWRPLVVLGLFVNGCVAGWLVTTARVLDGPGAGLVAFWLVQSSVLVLLVVLLIHALPLVAARGAGVRAALRNALVLTIAAPVPTLGMVGLLVGLAVATLWVGPGMWLIVPVVAAAFLAANCEIQVARLRGEGNTA